MINRLFSAALFPEQFRSPNFLRSSAGILEQILLSASNFVTAMVVVSLSGIEALGVYSVVLVLANYIKALFATLLHRQMVLAISAKSAGAQKGIFLATSGLQMLFTAALIVLGIIAGFTAYRLSSLEQIHWLILGVSAYIASGVFFELFRQYLYATDAQTYSLKCTFTAVGLQLAGLIAVAVLITREVPVFWYFVILAIGFLGAITINHVCLSVLRETRWIGWHYALSKLRNYWQHARYSLVGMSITWLQNQSITPLLLAFTNPLVVGYFSLARLMIMPLAVINQGLVNSSTPQLRRLAETQSTESVTSKLRKFSRINMIISLVYISILIVTHLTGLLDQLIPDYTNVKWFLVFWVVSLIITMQRFWISQFFVVYLQFKFLLISSTVAAFFTMIGMIATGISFNSVTLPLLFYIGGETLFILLLLNGRRKFDI